VFDALATDVYFSTLAEILLTCNTDLDQEAG
jgi:hypothetical protein